MGDPRQVREAWHALGRLLAARRKAAGLNQEALGAQTQYSRSSIGNIEVGLQHVDRSFWLAADRLVGAAGELVRGYDAAEALHRAHHHRNDQASMVPKPIEDSNSSGRAPVDLLEEPAQIHDRVKRLAVSNVDEAKLLYLEGSLADLIAENERRPPEHLVPRVRHLRIHVDQLLSGRQHPPQRARLYATAAYLSGILSVLALDLNNFAAARAYSTEAFQIADTVEQSDLQAWTRGVQSLIAYYSGRYHDALAYADDGLRRAPHSDQKIRLIVNGRARSLARLGDRYGVDAAVDAAWTELERRDNAPHISASITLGSYCRARTAANAATAYLALAEPAEVTRYTYQALADFDKAGLSGPQALSRLDLATAALQHERPDLDQASAMAMKAFSITTDQGFESVNLRARQFIEQAAPWADHPKIQEVAGMLRSRVLARADSAIALPSRHGQP